MIAGLVRVESWTRLLIPGFTTLLLFLVELLPWEGRSPIGLPNLSLIAIFYWSVRLPPLCPPLFVLGIGLGADLLEMTPLGAQASIALAIALIARQRAKRLGQLPFIALWSLFAFTIMLQSVFLWISEAILAGTLLPFSSLLVRALLTIALFPVVAKLFLLPAEKLALEAAHGG